MARRTVKHNKSVTEVMEGVKVAIPTIRKNKDGSLNGGSLHGHEMNIRRTFYTRNQHVNCTWNEACEFSRLMMEQILSSVGFDRNGRKI